MIIDLFVKDRINIYLCIRILNYYGITKCSKWKFAKSDGNAQNMGVYPHLGWINGWSKGVAIDPYNLSWDDYDDGSGDSDENTATL